MVDLISKRAHVDHLWALYAKLHPIIAEHDANVPQSNKVSLWSIVVDNQVPNLLQNLNVEYIDVEDHRRQFQQQLKYLWNGKKIYNLCMLRKCWRLLKLVVIVRYICYRISIKRCNYFNTYFLAVHLIENLAGLPQRQPEQQQLLEHYWLVSAFVDDIDVNRIPKKFSFWKKKRSIYFEFNLLSQIIYILEVVYALQEMRPL